MKLSLYQRARRFVFLLSFILFPFSITLFSPYLSIGGAWTGAVTVSVLFFAFLLVTSPFLGRLFCSWVCPAGQFQDQVAQIRTVKAGRPGRWWFKYLVWSPWLAFLLGGLVSSWLSPKGLELQLGWTPDADTFSAAEPMYAPLISLAGNFIISLFVLTVFLIPSLVLGQRGGCHTLCWMSPFMILGRKIGNLIKLPAIRLKSESEKCIQCSKCSAACPTGIPVMLKVQQKNMEHAECILCGQCVDACPKTVLSIGISR